MGNNTFLVGPTEFPMKTQMMKILENKHLALTLLKNQIAANGYCSLQALKIWGDKCLNNLFSGIFY